MLCQPVRINSNIPLAEEPVKSDEVFFRIVHTSVARHKVAMKGSLAGTDIAIQVIPTFDVIRQSGKPRYILSLNVGGDHSQQASVAGWLSNTNVSADDLMANLKQWTIQRTSLFDIKLDTAPANVNKSLQRCKVDQQLAENILHQLAACKAYGPQGTLFVPHCDDAEQVACMDALRTANVIESNAEGHVRLSEIGVSLVSRRLSLEVQEPFLFFAGRQGVPHHKSSILELMLELQSRGWVKRIDPPRPRHIRPFRHDASEDDEEGRKLFYSTSKTIPCRMYLTALLEGPSRSVNKIYHLQCVKYYKCLMLYPESTPPFQTAQYYVALMSRNKANSAVSSTPKHATHEHEHQAEGGQAGDLEEDGTSFSNMIASSSGLPEPSRVGRPRKRKAAAISTAGVHDDGVAAAALSNDAVSEGAAAGDDQIDNNFQNFDLCSSSGHDSDSDIFEPGPLPFNDDPNIPLDPTQPSDLLEACELAMGAVDNTVCPVDSSVQQLQPKGPDATPPPQLEDVQCDRRAESLAPLVPHAPPTPAALAATPARRGVSQRMPAQQPRRSMRDHPNSFAHGIFNIVYRDDSHGTSYTAYCPLHSFPGKPKCCRDTRTNQPDAETVKLRLKQWCNLASRWPVDITNEMDVAVARQGHHGRVINILGVLVFATCHLMSCHMLNLLIPGCILVSFVNFCFFCLQNWSHIVEYGHLYHVLGLLVSPGTCPSWFLCWRRLCLQPMRWMRHAAGLQCRHDCLGLVPTLG